MCVYLYKPLSSLRIASVAIVTPLVPLLPVPLVKVLRGGDGTRPSGGRDISAGDAAGE